MTNETHPSIAIGNLIAIVFNPNIFISGIIKYVSKAF